MKATRAHQEMIAAIEQALREGRASFAETSAAALLESAPALPEAWLLSGRIHALRARWTDAEKAFARLEKLSPGHRGGALARGHLLVRLGCDAEAIVEFRRAANGVG